jgi:hypothetical protein
MILVSISITVYSPTIIRPSGWVGVPELANNQIQLNMHAKQTCLSLQEQTLTSRKSISDMDQGTGERAAHSRSFEAAQVRLYSCVMA